MTDEIKPTTQTPAPDTWQPRPLTDAYRELTPKELEIKQQIEAAFRRGYFQGVSDTIEATRAGVTLRRLIDHYNGILWNWRFPTDHYEKVVQPPEMPKGE